MKITPAAAAEFLALTLLRDRPPRLLSHVGEKD